MNIPLLEVVIPTYKRPGHARRAIESCLSIDSNDLVVSCNSNGPEPFLEPFRNKFSRVRYSNFEENLGPQANFGYLAKQVQAKYFMLLSDEDYLDPRCAQRYLTFLKSLEDRVAVVSSYIYDLQRQASYTWPRQLNGKLLDINQYLYCSEPIPTYMSGLVFKADLVTDELIDQCIAIAHGSNSYGHLDLILSLLDRGGLVTFCSHMLVIKGDEAKTGGDSHSHKVLSSGKSMVQYVVSSDYEQEENLDLNPSVYGPEARMRQFIYRMTKVSCLSRAKALAKSIGSLHLLVFFLKAILQSPCIVRLPDKPVLSKIVEHCLKEFPEISAFPKAWVQAFYFVIRFNRPFGSLCLRALSIFLGLSRNATLAFFV